MRCFLAAILCVGGNFLAVFQNHAVAYFWTAFEHVVELPLRTKLTMILLRCARESLGDGTWQLRILVANILLKVLFGRYKHSAFCSDCSSENPRNHIRLLHGPKWIVLCRVDAEALGWPVGCSVKCYNVVGLQARVFATVTAQVAGCTPWAEGQATERPHGACVETKKHATCLEKMTSLPVSPPVLGGIGSPDRKCTIGK